MSLYFKMHFLIQLQGVKMNIYLKPLSSFLRASASSSVISLSRSRSLFLSCVGLREYLWLGRRSNWTVLRALFWVVWYSVLPLQNRLKNMLINNEKLIQSTICTIHSILDWRFCKDFFCAIIFLHLVWPQIKSIL